MEKSVRKYLSSLGKIGGASRSDRKVEAVRSNLAKARETRWINHTKKAKVVK